MANKGSEPMVPDYITALTEGDPSKVVIDDIDEFVRQMMGVAIQSFGKILDLASQNEKLRADVFSKLNKDTHLTIEANNTEIEKIIDNATANSELIRQIIQKKMVEDGFLSSEEFKMLFHELRNYHDDMKRASNAKREENEKLLHGEVMAADKALQGSEIYKYIAGLAGGFVLGWGGKALYDYFTKKR